MSCFKGCIVNIFTSGRTHTQVTSSPKDATASRPSDHTSIQSRGSADARREQNDLLIWLDSSIDEVNNDDSRNTITSLQCIFNSVNTFNDREQCINFLNTIASEKVVMIISGTFGERIVSEIHDLCQIDSIYIFCMDKPKHEQWANRWFKIKGVFTDITHICKALQQAATEYERNSIPISFALTNNDLPSQNVDQSNQSFMYTQLLKEILLDISFKQTDFKEFIEYHQKLFRNNEFELGMIDELKRKYNKKTAITWYTRDCFLYERLNRALRLMNIDIIVRMGFFVRDLHNHIKQLHSKQYGGSRSVTPFVVYRGQGFSINDFQQMSEAKDRLLSFNNFLSTSKDRNVSFHFAQRSLENSNKIGVLFIMTIDPSKSSTPFAFVNDISCHQTEDEILFSMHTVFRIDNIKSTIENNRLFEVELTQTSDNDHELCALTKRMRDQIDGYSGWDALGRLFIKLGRSDKAQQVYEGMLKIPSNDYEKANIYNQLGWTNDNHGEYDESISFYKKALAITEKVSPVDNYNLASSYNNIGVTYTRMGDYLNALSFHKKALELRQKILHLNHPKLADSYNNVGLLYQKTGDLSNAYLSLEKAFQMRRKHNLPNNPDLAESYNNLSLLCKEMGKSLDAELYNENAVAIRQKVFPSNHPTLATSYNRMGSISLRKADRSNIAPIDEHTIYIERPGPPNYSSDIQIN